MHRIDEMEVLADGSRFSHIKTCKVELIIKPLAAIAPVVTKGLRHRISWSIPVLVKLHQKC
ncbi:hypothetical protein F7734_23690 [Scytonema sp. UIC 10036]|uniref:hypothetical protein n=1 Tax=Scytonema sp. UIC 10036 TaxID=2304196 RepID=UPI0012DA66E4|nr:hypothetical protein [Scytonema sp. UIC 10036]MUG95197.1 hypothetical protein [Scytonema sp. UIC 10036]